MFRSHRFNELTGARYAAKASLSPSNPFRPQIENFVCGLKLEAKSRFEVGLHGLFLKEQLCTKGKRKPWICQDVTVFWFFCDISWNALI